MSETAGASDRPAGPSVWWSVIILAAFLAILPLGMSLLRTREAMPAGMELSVPRVVFSVANAASLTGFQQTIAVDNYKPRGRMLIFALIVAGTLASMIVGAAAVVRLLRLPYSMIQIVGWAMGVELFAVLLGVLFIDGRGREFQAVSALGNCGVVIGQVVARDRATFHLVILPLAVLGGIGLPVLMELFDLVRVGRPISTHSRVVLSMTATVYLVGFGLLALLHWPEAPTKEKPHPPTTQAVLVESSTTSLNARTVGWPVESVANWPRAAVWVVMLLMAVGASPAGTGGGVKTTTLYALGRGTWGTLRGRAASRVFGFAIVWLGIYLLLVLLTTMVLVTTEPQLATDQILFTSISAASNAGLSYAPISITGNGAYALAATMLLGRLLPLVILWWMALTTRDADVAIG